MSPAEMHTSEPWFQDPEDPRVILDRNRDMAALAISVENAQRIIASVNAVRNVSSASLDAGIVDEGLHCLALLCRYHSEDDYRTEIDRDNGFQKLVARGSAVWDALKKESLYRTWK